MSPDLRLPLVFPNISVNLDMYKVEIGSIIDMSCIKYYPNNQLLLSHC